MPQDDENPASSGPQTPGPSAAHMLIIGARSAEELEAVARRLHRARGRGRFVRLRLAGLPEVLAESEIFGHVHDGFPGAFRDKPGALELAAGGTLLIDGVDELSPRVAARLTRALVMRRTTRIGNTHAAYPVEVSIVSTISRPLDERRDPILANLCAQFTIVNTV